MSAIVKTADPYVYLLQFNRKPKAADQPYSCLLSKTMAMPSAVNTTKCWVDTDNKTVRFCLYGDTAPYNAYYLRSVVLVTHVFDAFKSHHDDAYHSFHDYYVDSYRHYYAMPILFTSKQGELDVIRTKTTKIVVQPCSHRTSTKSCVCCGVIKHKGKLSF